MATICPDYWENLVTIIVGIGILALIIERGLYQVFDSKLWKKVEEELDKQTGGDFMDLKPWISVIVSLLIVFTFKIDMIAMIFKQPDPRSISLVITALFIAGGSTGIYKFLKRARELKEAAQKQKIAEAQEAAKKK